MERLRDFLTEYANENLDHIVISRPRDKKNPVSRIKVRPVLLKGQLMFQETSFDGPKALHSNHDKASLTERIMTLMKEDYVQIEFTGEGISATGLVNRKGDLSLKVKKQTGPGNEKIKPKSVLAHDRKKKRILEDDESWMEERFDELCFIPEEEELYIVSKSDTKESDKSHNFRSDCFTDKEIMDFFEMIDYVKEKFYSKQDNRK